jgi:predicted AAA+ superfamily ATPase
MLALYHLFSGVAVSELPGADSIPETASLPHPPQARRAVLVGTALSPGQSHKKPDGTVVHTLWGELAWQLLGKDGFKRLADADRQGVSPGSDVLRELLKQAAPCLVLIDEWVAYVRQLLGKDGLPGGSFSANLTFAQALTEAARAVPRAMVVVSLPSSDIEIGGEAGKEALDQLKNTLGRIESPWRPASAEEGFEIVRRRLFQPITDPQLFAARDGVVRAFAELYWGQHQEFPAECREGEYERRLKAAYPIR